MTPLHSLILMKQIKECVEVSWNWSVFFFIIIIAANLQTNPHWMKFKKDFHVESRRVKEIKESVVLCWKLSKVLLNKFFFML